MSTRKIAECINVRINVGNFQHIELTKYAEEEIEFSSNEERTKKEDALRDDLVVSLIRSMKAIPERLGKGIESAIQVEESIQKAIPEWLANSPIPNIANGAAKLSIKASAEQKAHKEKQDEIIPEVLKSVTVDTVTEVTQEPINPTTKIQEDAEDLFESDEVNQENKKTVVAKTDAVEVDTIETDSKTDDDIFDDDIFGND